MTLTRNQKRALKAAITLFEKRYSQIVFDANMAELGFDGPTARNAQKECKAIKENHIPALQDLLAEPEQIPLTLGLE